MRRHGRMRKPIRLPKRRSLTGIVPEFDDLDKILRPLFKRVWDRKGRVQILENGKIIQEFEIKKTHSKHSSYDNFRLKFLEEGGGSGAETVLEPGMKIRVSLYQPIKPRNFQQKFREGEDHCVFTPLIAKWSEVAKTASTQKYNDTVLKRIKKIAEEYGDKPVPQNEMELLGKKCETTFRIKDPIGKNFLLFNEGARKTVILQNSFMNHVDEVPEKKPKVEIEHEYAIYRANHLQDGEILEGSFIDPLRIHTQTEILEVKNPMIPSLNEIENLIPDIKFDASKYPEVNSFILDSRIINSGTLKFREDFDEHYDLESAYTQFHQTKYYQGFLGVIHQWRNFTFPPTQHFLKEHNGIYKAKIIKPSPLAKMLGFQIGKCYILPLPEWNFHRDTKTEFTIISGVYGSTFDFRFPESSFITTPLRNYDSQNEKRTTNKPFRIFAGQLSSKVNETDTKTFRVKSTPKFARQLKSLYPDTDYDYDTKTAIISIAYKKVYTKHHLFSFITSYTRIVMMQEMMKFDISNLSAVTLDGLYFKGKVPDNLIPQFRLKPANEPSGTKLWYEEKNNEVQFPLWSKDFNCNTFLEGAGGSGKTHRILKDAGFNNVLYASPTHELGKDKVKEYNINHYTTIHRLVGLDPQKKSIDSFRTFHGEPSVILVDEITQIERDFIELIIKMYPHSLILIAGDVDSEGRHYQCKYSNEIWTPTFPIVSFLDDYRAKSNTLKQMKKDLRTYMKTDPTPKQIKNYVYINFNAITKEQAMSQFTKEDVWIAGTHKYIKTLQPHKIYTTHSYQGRTIHNPTKLYISIEDMFESTMFYTAMSRVEHEDQLIIVGK